MEKTLVENETLTSSIISKLSRYKKKFKILFSTLLMVGVCLFFIFWQRWELPLISPLDGGSKFEFISLNQILPPDPNNPKIVYGFLPYWNLNQVVVQPELTHLSYFGLNVDENGNIVTHDIEGKIHPGYLGLTSDRLLTLAQNINQNNKSFEVTLVQFESDKIEKIINNPQAHENLIMSLDSILLAYSISGINIDIEYTGTASQELRDNFATMIEKISQHLNQKFSNVQLSIDMYASASNNKQIWDVPRIAKSVDYIIVMAYDFHRRSSPQAGPVAPLFSNNQWGEDIHKNLRDFLRYVPRDKILLGIPFYGYEWRVDDKHPLANTYPDTGMTASYQRVKNLIQDPNIRVEEGWDEKALCPYLIYHKDNNIHVIYYENQTSISYKLEYVKQLDLAGIAIWALGYEGLERDLWEAIKI